MKNLFILVSLALVACEKPLPPKPPNNSMVDKAWETDAIWYDICKQEKPAMCYGAVYHPELHNR